MMTPEEVVYQSVIAVGSVLVGLFFGQRLSDRHENKNREADLDKVHKLLSSDFSMMKRITNLYRGNYKVMYDYLNQNGHLVCFANLNNVTQFLTEIYFDYMFAYWDVLRSSGLLLKLNPDEIKMIQVAHDKIMEGYAREKYENQKFADICANVLQGVQAIPPNYSNVQEYLRDYFYGVYSKINKFFEDVDGYVLSMTAFDWFDPKGEFQPDLSKIKKTPTPNLSRLHATTPVVVGDKTIYPNGDVVDSHGTIIKNLYNSE